MEGARRCKYRARYYDLEAEEWREWECDMPALPGREYCLFHDPEYWREHPEEVRKAFYERVREAMASEGPAYFIGYHLPEVRLGELGEEVIFRGPVYFNRAVFHKSANFDFVSFFGPAEFNFAGFFGPTSFVDVFFSGPARFVFTIFSGDTSFECVRFLLGANFACITVSGRLRFRWCSFPSISEDPLSLVPKRVIFREVAFGERGQILFEETDMSRVSLLFTDLSQVEFRRVRWWDYGGSFMILDALILLARTNKGLARRYREMARKQIAEFEEALSRGEVPEALERLWHYLRDEIEVSIRREAKSKGQDVSYEELFRMAEEVATSKLRGLVSSWARDIDSKELERDEDIALENVLQELRDLKDWHIARRRYEEAAKFHIAEMEVRRLAGREEERHVAWPPKSRWRRLKERVSAWMEKRLLWLYRTTCLYGESLARPVAWLLAIWLLFGLIYALSGLIAAPGLATALQLLAEGLAFSGSVIALMLLFRAAPDVAAWSYIAWAEGALALLIYAVFLPTIMRRIWRLVKA